MRDADLFKLITKQTIPANNKFSESSHKSLCFIDDANHLVASKSISDLNKYLEQFHKVLVGYYDANGLAMNRDKTKVLLYSPCKDDQVRFSVGTSPRETQIFIKDDKQIKVLGFWLNKSNNMSTHISHLNSSVCNTPRILNPVLPKTSMTN